MGGGKNTPPAPDYTGAAREQAQSSKEITNMQTWANRPEQRTPFGNVSWSTKPIVDPATGQLVTQWTQNMTMAPDLQQALDSQQRVTLARSGLAEQLTGRLQGEMGSPMDWSNLSPMGQRVAAQDLGNINDFRNNAENAVYNRMKSRLDPDWAQREANLRTQLYNAGVREGDQPFNSRVGEFERARGDAYQNAMDAAIMAGTQEMGAQAGLAGQLQNQQQQASAYDTLLRQQQIAEQLQQRGFSLNEINAALMGQQVAMPNMPSFTTAGASQPINSLAAAQAQGQYALDAYNAKQQALQGMLSGVTGIGANIASGGLMRG